MKLVSPFSKTTLIYGGVLLLVAVLGFTAVRAHYLFSVLNEEFASAIVNGFTGENYVAYHDTGPPPGSIPLGVLFWFFIMPIIAMYFGVFPGMPWGYAYNYLPLSCGTMFLFIVATYTTQRYLSDGYRNAMLWLLLFLWGLYGLYCFWEIGTLMGI